MIARRGVLGAMLAAGVAGAGNAQDRYPSKPIRLVIPFPPGGGADAVARPLGPLMTETLGQPILLDNRGGANGNLGAEIVAKAPADGYTLLLASQTNAISASLYRALAYDPIEDFAPIALIGREPGVLVVYPALPVTSVAEFVAYAKARPGKVDYASSGNGSGQHLFMALFASMTDLKLNHVPYRGSGQATTDLLGGTVAASIPGTAGMVGHIKAGKLRPLAVTGTKRSPQLPDVPTMAEAGVPGYEAYVWLGLMAPKATPQSIITRLNREVVAALATPEVRAYMATAGIEIVGSTPAEFGVFFRAERDQWAKVVRETGARIE